MTEPRSRKDVILSKKPIVAICYDFDKTLSPDDMQAFTFIPSIGMDKQAFWDESNALAKDNRMDKNVVKNRFLNTLVTGDRKRFL